MGPAVTFSDVSAGGPRGPQGRAGAQAVGAGGGGAAGQAAAGLGAQAGPEAQGGGQEAAHQEAEGEALEAGLGCVKDSLSLGFRAQIVNQPVEETRGSVGALVWICMSWSTVLDAYAC